MVVSSDICEVHDEDERGDPDEDRPERDEEVRERGIDDRWVTSDVFESVEAMTTGGKARVES